MSPGSRPGHACSGCLGSVRLFFLIKKIASVHGGCKREGFSAESGREPWMVAAGSGRCWWLGHVDGEKMRGKTWVKQEIKA